MPPHRPHPEPHEQVLAEVIAGLLALRLAPHTAGDGQSSLRERAFWAIEIMVECPWGIVQFGE